jgi:putative addiction module component (TIGR02574 family)
MGDDGSWGPGRRCPLRALSPDERLELLERLWDSLSRTPASVPLTDPQRVELDRRLDALDEDVSQGLALGVPWDEVVGQVRTRG